MIVFDSVTFRYPGHPVLFEQFSWQVNAGEAWAVLGTSGCGKTTLLYLTAGLQIPESGVVTVNGSPLHRPRPQTGLILQDFGLLPWATVRQNVMLGLDIRRFYGPDGKHAPQDNPTLVSEPFIADQWIDQLGLGAVAHQYPGRISGGQRQRTAIARTLALAPDLLLMDEPFAALDAPTREALQKQVSQLHRQNHLTTLLVTHSIEEAAFMGNFVLVLGKAPNRSPVIFKNPAGGDPDYLHSEAYSAFCRQLRTAVETV